MGKESDSTAAATKSLQSCPTLCDPIDGSPPGDLERKQDVTVFFHTTEQLQFPEVLTRYASNLTQFWHCIQGNSVRSHMLRACSHKTAPTSDTSSNSRSSPVLLTESESRSVMSDSLRPHGPYSPWNSPGQNTGVCSLSLLYGIFPTQGSNPGLPHCRWILYRLSHKGSPRILEGVAYTFSSRSFRPRNGTRVSCIAGKFFINWAMCFWL